LISIIIVAYPLIIPSPPRLTFVAAVLAAAMAPLGLAIYELSSGTAVPGVFYERNTFYPAVAVVIAYFGSRVVHGITAEVAEARRVGVYELVEPLGRGAWASSTVPVTPCCTAPRRSSCYCRIE
jgi:peptidoglycan/LPS O-acetylase OafA/YrhL